VRLDRGKVRCVIPHEPGRIFSVVTANARVIDVGTVFSVSVEPSAGEPTTVVHVEEGEVLVEHAGRQSRLTASQSWSSAQPPPKLIATPPVAASVAPPEETRPAPSPPRRDSAPAKRPRQTLAAETELLRSGLAKEQRGDLRGARGDYEALVARYPDSPLALDAKGALARVRARLQSSK
jgi:ferric-dicitrate binding protein FerR (iron transport regulator)